MEPSSRRHRFRWIRNLPPVFSLMLVVAFGIIFYQVVKEFDLSSIHFSRLFSILSPFIIGLVITFFLVAPVKFLERQFLRLPFFRKRRAFTNFLSVLISYVIVLGLLVLILVYIVPQIFSGLSTLFMLLTDAIEYLYDNLNTFISHWNESSWSTLISGEDLYQLLGNYLSSLTLDLQNIASTVLPMLYKTIASVASGSINTIIGIIISIYLVSDRRNMAYGGKRILYALLRKDRANRILTLLHEILNIFRRFFVGQALDSLLIGIICFIFMKIFSLPYAELISVIIGVTNIIPYFGPFLGAIPSILIILMVSPMEALIFAIFILVLQQIDGNIICPAVLGGSLGLKPIWIIFAVTVGGGLFGVLGMIIGVPTFTVIYTLWHRYIRRRIHSKKAGETPAAFAETAKPAEATPEAETSKKEPPAP